MDRGLGLLRGAAETRVSQPAALARRDSANVQFYVPAFREANNVVNKDGCLTTLMTRADTDSASYDTRGRSHSDLDSDSGCARDRKARRA